MDLEKAKASDRSHFANLFNRLEVMPVRGDGVFLFDAAGKKYYDMFAGVAVSSIGHNHPRLIETIKDQASKLIHVSNWVYNEPQALLNEKLSNLTGLSKVFYTNDGTGAVEAAFKLARRSTGKKEIISMENSFHGRTLGALSATWNEKYRKPFEPLVPGFKFAKYDDIESLRQSIGDDTAAVIVEPVLGEAGAMPAHDEYLREVREITEEKEVLMIVDEIQTGFGRTGQWFDFQRMGIKPDILTVAKGMGAGFPIGAICFDGVDFEPGNHGGTYNGSPLGCAIANTVIDVIKDEKLVENAGKLGDHIMKSFGDKDIHGKGLMLGIETEDGRSTCEKLIENGVLSIYSGNTLRLLPPLILNKKDADNVIGIIKEVLQ